MALPSLGSLFQVGVPMLSGHLQGQLQGQELLRRRQQEDEDRQRRMEMDELNRQLLEVRLSEAQHPRKPWEAQGFTTPDEQMGYLESLQRIQNPRLTPWESAGFSSEQDYLDHLDRKEAAGTRPPWEEAGFPDEQSYLAYLDREGRAKYPDRYDGGSSYSRMSPEERRNSFLWQYLMATGKVQDNPLTLDVVEGPAPPSDRIREAFEAWSELERLTDPEYNPADDIPAGPPEGWHPPMAPDADPGDFPTPDPVASPTEAPDAQPIPAPAAPAAPAAPRPAGMTAKDRIAQLKAQGIGKDEALRILRQEGLVDVNGFVVGE